MKLNKIQQGFTIVEMLIYVGIFSVVAGALIAFIQITSQSRINNQVVLDVNDQSVFILKIITQDLRNASAINLPATSTSSNLLSINTAQASTSPTIFSISSGIVYRTQGNGQPIALNNNKIQISNLEFLNLSKSGTPGSVKVSFTAQDNFNTNSSQYNYSSNFYGSASLR